MTFRLVRAEPSDSMIEASAALKLRRLKAAFYDGYEGVGVRPGVAEEWAAMLSASEPLTDAEIDGLCAAFWPIAGHWMPNAAEVIAKWNGRHHYEVSRAEDRTRMRAFIMALEGHPK